MRVYLGNEHIRYANMKINKIVDGIDTSNDTVVADASTDTQDILQLNKINNLKNITAHKTGK